MAGHGTLQEAKPVLKTGDFARSRRFYVEGLGFAVVEEGGDPPQFGIFRRDGCILFVDGWHGGPSPVPGTWDVYVHVKDIEAVQASFEDAGVKLTRRLHMTVYNMRELEVTDPDGNVICFGENAP